MTLADDAVSRLETAAARCEGAAVQALNSARQAEQAANRAADEALKVHQTLLQHERSEAKYRARVDSWIAAAEVKLSRIEDDVDHVEEATGEHARARLDSERAKLRRAEDARRELLKWIGGIVAALLISGISVVAGYAAKGFLADVNKPAQAVPR